MDLPTSSQRSASPAPRELPSFRAASVIVFVLYWFLYVPGLVLNIILLRKAMRVRDEAGGRAPRGFGCLNVLLWVGLIQLWVLLDVWGIMHPGDPVRAGVARARSEMRNLQHAIDAYQLEHGVYPAYTFDRRQSLAPRRAAEFEERYGRIPTFRAPGDTPLATLTSPVAYISSLPQDNLLARPFRHSSYAYWSDGGGFILWSPGPDGEYAITAPETVYDSSVPQRSALLLSGYTWDPTNGTVSPGDVWRISQ